MQYNDIVTKDFFYKMVLTTWVKKSRCYTKFKTVYCVLAN